MGSLQDNPVAAFIARVGALALTPVEGMGRMGVFLFNVVSVVFVPPLKLGRVVKRVQFIGFQSLVVVLLTGLFTGMVLGYQGYYTLSRVGSTAFLGGMVALSLLRELGPVITALMVTARAGSALSAEIGIMRNNEEIDALKLMGLSPFRYLMSPIFLAALLSLPLLTGVFNCIGVAGGYLVGVKLLGVGAGTYMGQMADYVRMSDITNSLYKSVTFGGLIAWVCCYKGYYAGFGAEGVSKATTQAVVMASVLILMFDYFLTSFLF